MLDVIGAISLTFLAVAGTGAVILAASLERARTIRLLALAAAWFAAIFALGAADAFTRLGTGAIGVAVVAPVIILALSAARVPSLRALAFGTPVAVLIAIHVGRLLGGFFLALHEDGRLPATFARTAGWGDIAVALLALPIAWMAARRAPHWRAAALLWNAIAFVDLLTAVTLGIGSAPDSPLRFIYEETATGTINALPWILIPGFLVPVYLLTHLGVFGRAVRERGLASSSLTVGLSHR